MDRDVDRIFKARVGVTGARRRGFRFNRLLVAHANLYDYMLDEHA